MALIRRAARPPEITLLLRAGFVLLLVASVFLIFLLDRDGLLDQIDGHVSVSDIFYFTMVTITTVGYGDIVPVSDQARLIDAFFVTPVRIFVWLTFLGTAYQLIIQRLIEEWRMLRLQRELKDHVILCGYGHSGSIAASELLLRGWEPEQLAVIDDDSILDAAGQPLGDLGAALTRGGVVRDDVVLGDSGDVQRQGRHRARAVLAGRAVDDDRAGGVGNDGERGRRGGAGSRMGPLSWSSS